MDAFLCIVKWSSVKSKWTSFCHKMKSLEKGSRSVVTSSLMIWQPIKLRLSEQAHIESYRWNSLDKYFSIDNETRISSENSNIFRYKTSMSNSVQQNVWSAETSRVHESELRVDGRAKTKHWGFSFDKNSERKFASFFWLRFSLIYARKKICSKINRRSVRFPERLCWSSILDRKTRKTQSEYRTEVCFIQSQKEVNFP